jgi:DnaJ-domain-containing protein 1
MVKSIDPSNAGFKDGSTRLSDDLNHAIYRAVYGASAGPFARTHGSEMLTSEDHRQLAERCIRLAKVCTEPSVAEYLMALAANYLELAEQTLRLHQWAAAGPRHDIR